MSRSTFLPDTATLHRLLARLGVAAAPAAATFGAPSRRTPLAFPAVATMTPATTMPSVPQVPSAAQAASAPAASSVAAMPLEPDLSDDNAITAVRRGAVLLGVQERPTVVLPAVDRSAAKANGWQVPTITHGAPPADAAAAAMGQPVVDDRGVGIDWASLLRGSQAERIMLALEVLMQRVGAVAGFIVDQDGLPLVAHNVEGALPAAASLYARAQRRAHDSGCQQVSGSLYIEISATEQLRLFWVATEWGRYGAGLLTPVEPSREATDVLQKILESALIRNNGKKDPLNG